MTSTRVVVVGSGNAGYCAAHAARDAGAQVTLVEKAPQGWGGGNSYFTAGAFRVAHEGFDALAELVSTVPEDKAGRTFIDAYPEEAYRRDLEHVTRGRTDPLLADLLISNSWETAQWMRGHNIDFELMYHRQAYEVDGAFRFWGGLALGAIGGGKGLIAAHEEEARRTGIEVRYDTAADELVVDESGAVCGISVKTPNGPQTLYADAVILAAGGFEADPRMRAAYLGQGWDLALVRGTPYNTGDGIEMALRIGAQAYGHWGGRHAVAWDAEAPATGDRHVTNQYTRGGYPFGIVVNSDGERFLDEGADFRNFTYAEYGARILEQPGSRAVQIFDAKAEPLLRPEEYAAPSTSKVVANGLEELAQLLHVDPAGLKHTVAQYNAAVNDEQFDPTVKDGKAALGIKPPKSNWAQRIDQPPYQAYPVTCGITFTFGGLRVDEQARVLDTSNIVIPGLFAAGELVGGLFYFNYPGGSGLTAGSVFGRIAGGAAAGN